MVLRAPHPKQTVTKAPKTTRSSRPFPRRMAWGLLAPVFLALTLLVGAKGCDSAIVGDECPPDNDNPRCDPDGTAGSNGASDDACGGLLGLSCDPGAFCNYPVGANCGAADQTGTCTQTPEVCADIYQPVCGCDGRTYGNACEAAANGMSVAAEGRCEGPEDPGPVDPPGRDCGGLLGLACSEGQYCDYPIDASCGAADQTGVCTTLPEACITLYMPVCGCDDQTYGNQCEAARAGVSVATQGACSPHEPGTVCGGLRGLACAADEYCEYPPDALCGRADATGVCAPMPTGCTREFSPVCGCDGITYGNACMAAAAGISVESYGACAADPGPERACGGLLGLSCADGEYCQYALEALCGAADQTGVCSAMPSACTREYAPVCGCDGNTYSNGCVAASTGVSVASIGECGS